MHGLIFETSVWLLAESTRLLPKLIPSATTVRGGVNFPREMWQALHGVTLEMVWFSHVHSFTHNLLLWVKAIITSDSEAHLNKPKLLFYEDFHFRMWIFTRRCSKLRTINNSGVQRSQTSGRTTYHRSTTYWTSILNFTITQSEMVNQLPHTNMRCELNTQLGVHLTISHIRFCKPALIATRLRDRCC